MWFSKTGIFWKTTFLEAENHHFQKRHRYLHFIPPPRFPPMKSFRRFFSLVGVVLGFSTREILNSFTYHPRDWYMFIFGCMNGCFYGINVDRIYHTYQSHGCHISPMDASRGFPHIGLPKLNSSFSSRRRRP